MEWKTPENPGPKGVAPEGVREDVRAAVIEIYQQDKFLAKTREEAETIVREFNDKFDGEQIAFIVDSENEISEFPYLIKFNHSHLGEGLDMNIPLEEDRRKRA